MIKRDINIYEKYNKPIASQRQISKKGLILVAGFLVVIIAFGAFWMIMNTQNSDLEQQIDEDTAWNNSIGLAGQVNLHKLTEELNKIKNDSIPFVDAILLLASNPDLTGEALNAIADFGKFKYVEADAEDLRQVTIENYTFKNSVITCGAKIAAVDNNEANRKLQAYIAKFDPENNDAAKFAENGEGEYYKYVVSSDGNLSYTVNADKTVSWTIALEFNYVKVTA